LYIHPVSRETIDCSTPGWSVLAEAALRQRTEVDLANFNFITHGPECITLARRYQFEFRPSREPSEADATFRTSWR
jgi:hypothetical protein